MIASRAKRLALPVAIAAVCGGAAVAPDAAIATETMSAIPPFKTILADGPCAPGETSTRGPDVAVSPEQNVFSTLPAGEYNTQADIVYTYSIQQAHSAYYIQSSCDNGGILEEYYWDEAVDESRLVTSGATETDGGWFPLGASYGPWEPIGTVESPGGVTG